MALTLLVDVSTIVRRDAGTGIQRVARAILLQLLKEPPAGYEVRAVRAGRWLGYRYADRYAASLAGNAPPPSDGGRVSVRAGDVFLALDLAAHLMPRHRRQLAGWKKRGAKLFFVVYDLLPALHPAWFTARAARHYARWMQLLAALADGAVCISRAGMEDLRRWLDEHHARAAPPLALRWFHLGADIEASVPSSGLPADFRRRLADLPGGTKVLMVGTLEPRKGHAQALSAFEALWRAGHAVNLLIVGRLGWNSRDLAERVRLHPESGRRLHWFDDASDEALAELYRFADGVLAASFAEGFGLPLVEAARHGKPLLVRDIPVFREVAGAHARFFSGDEQLAAELLRWAEQLREGSAPSSRGMPCLTWRESAAQLVERLALS